MVVKNYDTPLTIVGGGEFSSANFHKCLKIAPKIIAVDSGLNFLDINKNVPDWIIGDLDSVKNLKVWKLKGSHIKKIQEQETTDFEKCLYSFNAPFFLGNAFLGERIDHSMAAISALVKMKDKKVFLLGKRDFLFHINKKIELFIEFTFISIKKFFANTMIKNKVFDREVGQDTLIVVQLFIILLIFIFVWKIYL